ncbi:MAG: hypothetical protein H7A51_06565 [Akkermansiaceae bacterium]|nr:hypothetical protein [Akkermansiaceae bacterium]
MPKDHDGAGVICPACHYLLNLPGAESKRVPVRVTNDDAPKTLVPQPRDKKSNKPIVSRPLSKEDTLPAAQPALSGPDGQKRVRRKKQLPQAGLEWERKPSTKPEAPDNPMMWIVAGSLLGLTVVGIGAWLVIDSIDKDDPPADPVASLPSDASTEPLTIDEDQMTDEEKRRQQEIADSVKTGMSVLTDAEAVVRQYLNAKTPAELEALVRTPEVTVPRMRAWYAQEKWETPGAKDVGYGGRVTVKGVMASMAVRLNDYSIKQIALENTPDGYKVDWESWVAWSAMPWEDLFKKRPIDPVEVRVHCSLDSYYNRLFDDDNKWVAVRLEHPDSDRAIYGYIDKESPALMRMLGDLRNRGSVAATIKISYPEDSVAKNQVYINEYLQSGWVRPSADEESESTPAEDKSKDGK